MHLYRPLEAPPQLCGFKCCRPVERADPVGHPADSLALGMKVLDEHP